MRRPNIADGGEFAGDSDFPRDVLPDSPPRRGPLTSRIRWGNVAGLAALVAAIGVGLLGLRAPHGAETPALPRDVGVQPAPPAPGPRPHRPPPPARQSVRRRESPVRPKAPKPSPRGGHRIHRGAPPPAPAPRPTAPPAIPPRPALPPGGEFAPG